MKEYIVAVDEDVMNYEEYFVGYIRRQKELIRCKDCEWFGTVGCAVKIVGESDEPKENDYCSWAEPKEGEE